MAVIALDLGGTKLASAVVSRSGELRSREAVRLERRTGRAVGELIGRRLTEELARAAAGDPVVAVGLSVPGIAHQDTGTVWAPNIAGWEEYPLRDELRALLGGTLPIVIDSDRACCILGETWRGAAAGCRHAVFLTVGTGIGAGILADGRVLRGRGDVAGAIGWLALDRPYRPEYARTGCFEHHASGDGLARVAREELERDARYSGTLRGREAALTAHDVFRAAEAGDPLANRVLDGAVGMWGMAVANVVSLFNPERVVLGGGVFGPAAGLLDRIRAEAGRWAQPIAFGQTVIAVSALGPDAALYGAARLGLLAAEDAAR